MQVRCYACGLKLHDGMPTLEELSSDQHLVVTAGLPSSMPRSLTLEHPNFQGMSLNSFCPSCQDLILSLPHDAWRHDIPGHQWSQDPRLPWNHPDHFTTVFRCTCGEHLGDSKNTPEANRLFRRHLATVLDSAA